MNLNEFLQSMYGNAPRGYLTIWTLPDKRTAFFPVNDISAAVTYSESLCDNHDVYFGVGLRAKHLGEYQRGGNDDVSVVTAFWSDIDIKGEAHKETALPAGEAEALEFLNTLPLKPSIVVASGNGLHVYWQFAEAIAVMTAAHRSNIGDALSGWQSYINNAARERGWKLDNTSDLSRVLRIPGGINHKLNNKARVCVIERNDARYSPQDFTPYIAPKPQDGAEKSTTDAKNERFSADIGNSARIIEKCAFMQYCRDNAATLSEPYWYAMIGNLALCSDGTAVCHEYSRPYPQYNADECNKKIQHAQQAKKPHTCEYIRAYLGFGCGDCTTGCKAPVALAVITKADAVRELLAGEIGDYGTVFTDEYISALSYAKSQMPGDYAQFKLKHKGKLNIRDIELCIRDYNSRQRKTNGGTEPNGEALELDGIDPGGAVIPRRWTVTLSGGVRRIYETRDSDTEIIVCPDPVIIKRRLVNIDDDTEQLELCFFRDGRWKSVVAKRTQLNNKNNILALGDTGLQVTSNTASDFIGYLSDYEATNKNAIKYVPSTSRLGWLDDTQFFPYALNKEIIFEEDKGTASLYKNLAEHGDYTAWKEMMRKLRKNPIARFITSASFASPLLCKIGVRTFVIHLWHMSASGKSAALKAAVSVWGNPLKIMGNGFTTIVGTEQLAGTLRNLPFGIDEKQSADERRLPLEHLIYVLGQGIGKVRGAKGGGNADIATWHNIVMLTGEEPISRNSSLDGIQTRTFEIYGRPVDDVEFAKETHIISESNYGFAGAAFMRSVCAMLSKNGNCLKELYNQTFSREFKERGCGGIHADYIAAVAVGDYLAETLIFGTDAETALREAIVCGEEVYRLNEQQISSDSIERAWDFIVGWLVSNESRFSFDASPFYGIKSKSPGGQYDEFFVIPHYLDEILEYMGFNAKKTFQGLREQGLVETQIEPSSGKVRTKTRKRIDGKLVSVYAFRLKSSDIVPLGDNKATTRGE